MSKYYNGACANQVMRQNGKPGDVSGVDAAEECNRLDNRIEHLEATIESLTGERNGLLRQSIEFDAPMIKGLSEDRNEQETRAEKAEETLVAISKLPESWRGLIGIRVSSDDVDKAVDIVFEDLAFELAALIKGESK